MHEWSSNSAYDTERHADRHFVQTATKKIISIFTYLITSFYMKYFEPLTANAVQLSVEVVRGPNKHARAVIKNSAVTIKIPYKMNERKAEQIAEELYQRVKRSIIRHPERYANNKYAYIGFADGDRVDVLGSAFEIHINNAQISSTRAQLKQGRIEISVPAHYDSTSSRIAASKLARLIISRTVEPQLRSIVETINAQHFNAKIGKVKVRTGTSKWGSCSPNNNISLNFKLLFLPKEYLESVIVHELAHTRQRNHSERFWGIVYNVMPDYKQRRKELNRIASMPSAAERQSYESTPVAALLQNRQPAIN